MVSATFHVRNKPYPQQKPPQIKVGDTVPEAKFHTITLTQDPADNKTCKLPSEISTVQWKSCKVIVISVIGAFAPTCHLSHIPGYVEKYNDFLKKGVDRIVVLAVNDPYVMSAWCSISDPGGKIDFVTDANASWSAVMGLSVDLTTHELGLRTTRYVLVLDDNKVTKLFVEPEPGVVSVTAAVNVLNEL